MPLPIFSHPLCGTPFAPVVASTGRVSVFTQNDYRTAIGALGRLVIRRVRKLLEVELVGAVPDVHLRLEFLAALSTIFPITIVALQVVEATKSVTAVVAATTVPAI